MAAAGPCLSDDEVLAFGRGSLDPDARDHVEVHLDSCATCRRLVAALAGPSLDAPGGRTAEAGATTAPGASRDAAAPAPLDVIDGQYRIAQELGRGGMGVVYLARDLRLDRDVAVKIGTTVSGSSLQRVEREARALAKLSHPNVVVVHQVGEIGGRLYIAMEHVAGGSAREWLTARARAPREIVALYAAAGEGLAAAHEAGLVHRDFKPDNVLVGADDRPRVADFGLVRSGGSAGGDVVPAAEAPALERMTQTGAIVGTPAYMAPEQAAGEPVDERTDQFSFCVALWEALFGARPFVGRTPAELAVAMCAPMAPPPDRERARRVPRHVQAALRRGLARDPAARWPSMRALLVALRADPAVRRRRVIAGVALATAALGTAAGVGLALVVFGRSAAIPAAVPPSCPRLAAGARDVFVDASAAADRATGAAACPFHTITQALAARRGLATTVHVAAGTYDVAHGEHFPLIVRGDVELAGAGAATAHVVGAGPWDARGTAAGDGEISTTLVTGDEHATIRIGGLSFASGASSLELGGYGIVCDRGSLGALDDAPPDHAPSLIVHDVEVGPNYDAAVIATNTSRGTACALRVEHSLIHHDHFGVWGLGCGLVPQPGPRMTAGVDVVDTRFVGMRAASGALRGLGVAIWDCTRWATVRASTFSHSDGGVAVVNHDAPVTRVVIEQDTFSDLQHEGVAVGRAARIDRLVGNSFGGITAGPAAQIADRGIGLLLDSSNERTASPQVLYARDNAFLESDVAIELRGTTPFRGPIDFGRPDDAGHNVIRCNATLDGSAVPGHDLVVVAAIDPAAHLSFAGNVWDHAPPTASATRNGADLDAPAGVAVDTRAAIPARTACSSRGP